MEGLYPCDPNTFLSVYSTSLVPLVLFDGIIVNSLTTPGEGVAGRNPSFMSLKSQTKKPQSKADSLEGICGL